MKLTQMDTTGYRTMVTDHLKSYPAAFQEMGLTAVHHRGKRMNRAESSQSDPTWLSTLHSYKMRKQLIPELFGRDLRTQKIDQGFTNR